ncbi:uncharacterized protein LOC108098694 [Drosophila ficusphila]|uniref:uncharacterized protein LOC108098694 n=1 Tax=Drosophila ficusphila TaxID=30025 RepID=UPI0007E8857C|nr:uncharacterized protein LOC108098694 [Drosophila ficusphila]
MADGPEFNWEYSYGGQGNPYAQAGRASAAVPGGGGRQWLHSTQANTQHFVTGSGFPGSGSHPQHASPNDPFASYNQSMMSQYTNFKPSYGHSQVGPAAIQTVGPDPSQEMGRGMGRGMGNGMSESMGFNEGMNQGENIFGAGMGGGSRRGGQRLAGGYSARSNGLNDSHLHRNHRGSWF